MYSMGIDKNDLNKAFVQLTLEFVTKQKLEAYDSNYNIVAGDKTKELKEKCHCGNLWYLRGPFFTLDQTGDFVGGYHCGLHPRSQFQKNLHKVILIRGVSSVRIFKDLERRRSATTKMGGKMCLVKTFILSVGNK
ncbi:uncharacterized protein [Aristolochia californica]|uniref:uncharacterized protein n=1 Tax=Aristolochia californica TaxID=171875 RepID=UPI0035DD5DCE